MLTTRVLLLLLESVLRIKPGLLLESGNKVRARVRIRVGNRVNATIRVTVRLMFNNPSPESVISNLT